MTTTSVTYVGDGSTTDFNYNFTMGVAKNDDVKVKLSVSGAVTTPNFTIIRDGTVRLSTAPAKGTRVTVFRETDIDNPAVTFVDGSLLTNDNLNNANKQVLRAVQESRSGNLPEGIAHDLNLNNHEIVNVATDKNNPSSVVNMQTLISEGKGDKGDQGIQGVPGRDFTFDYSETGTSLRNAQSKVSSPSNGDFAVFSYPKSGVNVAELYERKGGAWSFVANIKGDKGDTGKGTKGDTGQSGLDSFWTVSAVSTTSNFIVSMNTRYVVKKTTAGTLNVTFGTGTNDGDFVWLFLSEIHKAGDVAVFQNGKSVGLYGASKAGTYLLYKWNSSRNTWVKTSEYSDLGVANDKFAQKDLSNLATGAFRSEYDKLGIVSGLSTTIFTQTSGKFFVRKADGSLPTGIDSSKVWSLAQQKTAKGGTAPSGKTHIELPVGTAAFKVSGGGGSGGNHDGYNGNNGGDSSIVSPVLITASGGYGGASANGGSGYRSPEYSPPPPKSSSGGIVLVGHGAYGSRGSTSYDWNSAAGSNGNVVLATKSLTAGQSFTFIVGSGGAGRSSRYSGRGTSYAGESGYIIVEYM